MLFFFLAFLVVSGRQDLHQTNPAGSPVPTTLATGGTDRTGPGIGTPGTVGSTIHHYEYVFPDGGMYVYNMDDGHRLVKSISYRQREGSGVSLRAPPLTRSILATVGMVAPTGMGRC